MAGSQTDVGGDTCTYGWKLYKKQTGAMAVREQAPRRETDTGNTDDVQHDVEVAGGNRNRHDRARRTRQR